MTDPKIEAFVEAADKLVNTLATTPQPSPAGKAAHDRMLEHLYEDYDIARRALVGDPAGDEG